MGSFFRGRERLGPRRKNEKVIHLLGTVSGWACPAFFAVAIDYPVARFIGEKKQGLRSGLISTQGKEMVHQYRQPARMKKRKS